MSHNTIAAEKRGVTAVRAIAPEGSVRDERSDGAAPLRHAWSSYLADLAPWLAMFTLTFEQADRTHNVTRTEAMFAWRRLVQVLNADLLGHHYTRQVGHSYFSYVLAFEPHSTGLLHMHALTDARTNWELAHRYWQGDKRPYHFGIIDIERVDDLAASCSYVAKYVSKCGELVIYKAQRPARPAFVPMWYMDNLNKC